MRFYRGLRRPVSFSIADGLALGIVCYPVLKLATSPFPSNTYGIEISQPPGVRLLKCVRGRARVVKLILSSRRP